MKILLLLLVCSLFSCGSTKQKVNNKEVKTPEMSYTVKGTIRMHKPYCGGARPTPEQERGTFEAIKATSYVLLDSLGNKVSTFNTANTAAFNLSLKNGSYQLFRADKRLSFEAFKKENTLEVDKNKEVLKDDCFLKWKNTPDLVFSVNNSDLLDLQITYRSKCFIGYNPCLHYSGPYRP